MTAKQKEDLVDMQIKHRLEEVQLEQAVSRIVQESTLH
jgi:hypothetical protein